MIGLSCRCQHAFDLQAVLLGLAQPCLRGRYLIRQRGARMGTAGFGEARPIGFAKLSSPWPVDSDSALRQWFAAYSYCSLMGRRHSRRRP
jgi:hypothetical protein